MLEKAVLAKAVPQKMVPSVLLALYCLQTWVSKRKRG